MFWCSTERLAYFYICRVLHQISESRVSRSVGAVVANRFPVYVTQSIPLSPEGVCYYPLHTLRILAVVHSDSAPNLSSNRSYPAVEPNVSPATAPAAPQTIGAIH
jgi:hypothetical protein